MLIRRSPVAFVALSLLFAAGCGASLESAPTSAPTTSTSFSSIVAPAPKPVAAPAVCDQLRTAATGTTVTVPAGDWIIGDCVVSGTGRAGVRVVAVNAAMSSGGVPSATKWSRLIGSLRCNDCDRWTFDGLAVEGDGSGTADPVFVVSMNGGEGWRWSRCDISNGVAPDGTRYGVRGVFNTYGPVKDWQLDACRVHDNGNTRPEVPDNNFDHLVYVNGADVDSNGRIGPNNSFFGNASGAAVKVGYGLDGAAPVGIRGVRVDGNAFRANSSPDGICGVLVAGASADTVVTRNRIDCAGGIDERTASAVALRSWPGGTRVTVTDNRITGTRNAGNVTKCGAFDAGAYDRSISVRVFGLETWAQVAPSSCAWWGITASGNVATPT
ncbi:MAG: hypothetical protein ACOYNI_12975 [Acidimicrobiia bacterium]